MHKHLPVCRITCALAVQIVSDKRSPPVAKHAQRLRIPIILKSLSGQKDRRDDPLIEHALDKLTETRVRIFRLVFIQDRIYRRQFFHMRARHFIHRHKRRPAAAKPRFQPSEHIRLDLISVTAKYAASYCHNSFGW